MKIARFCYFRHMSCSLFVQPIFHNFNCFMNSRFKFMATVCPGNKVTHIKIQNTGEYYALYPETFTFRACSILHGE
ncbi:hypothetical protein T4A_14344 [Trichinella pseudospiralis]|uniref:Uncharacterized protein n=1 Tax=Trichinella pseudospiralis TaxID=6337 RepID=A0A0V1F2M6_TRIPS|nr:hypothetical protein T4A_14344 [Trichinella pseudospiralis]KRY80288.1 hypothetical protein T4D_688 [Trichinella pseudospiralis]